MTRRVATRRGWIIAVAGLVCIAAAAMAAAWLLGPTPTRQRATQAQNPIQAQGPARAPVAGGPFSLVDPLGRPVTDRDFRGRFMLIYFGYTTCPNHCPAMLAMTAAALERLGPRAGRVQPILITVDPERDTPQIMGRFTTRFSPHILGLTGSPEQIEAVEMAYGVETQFRQTGPQPDAYRIDHPSAFFLVGPDGRFITEITGEGGPDDLVARIGPRL